MDTNSKIYVAGHQGLVGSAITRQLQQLGYVNLIVKTRQELDLLNSQQVIDFFDTHKPEYVFLAAAKVGGIIANRDYPADFIYQNLQIQNNVIHSAYKAEVKKLLFLGSSCIYPKLCPQPIKEEYLLTGALEETNKSYAIAKIAGIELCKAFNKQYGTKFFSIMPTNLYGSHDNFDLITSHVLPAIVRKCYEANSQGQETVTLWGTGMSKREFLYVDDLADAAIFLMNNYEGDDIINVGYGQDITIQELAQVIKEITQFKGIIKWDTSKPDGTPRKILDSSALMSLGWSPKVGLKEGIQKTYKWFLDNHDNSYTESIKNKLIKQ